MTVGTTDRLLGVKESKCVSKYMSTFRSLNEASSDEFKKRFWSMEQKIFQIERLSLCPQM